MLPCFQTSGRPSSGPRAPALCASGCSVAEAFICNFLQVADGLQAGGRAGAEKKPKPSKAKAKKAASPMTAVCRSFSQMAIELGQQVGFLSFFRFKGRLGQQNARGDAEEPETLAVCLGKAARHARDLGLTPSSSSPAPCRALLAPLVRHRRRCTRSSCASA